MNENMRLAIDIDRSVLSRWLILVLLLFSCYCCRCDVLNMSDNNNTQPPRRQLPSRPPAQSPSSCTVSPLPTSPSAQALNVDVQTYNPFRLNDGAGVLKPLPMTMSKEDTAEFRSLFDIPQTEQLYYVFTCVKDGRRFSKGRLFVGEEYLGFHSKVMGYECRDLLRFDKIQRISPVKVCTYHEMMMMTNSCLSCRTAFASPPRRCRTIMGRWAALTIDERHWEW